MSFRTTLIVGLIFIIALVGYFVFKEVQSSKPKQELVDVKTAYDIQRDRITRIRLSYGDESFQPITVEKRGNEWYLSEPVEAPADPDKIKYLLDDLLNKRVKMRFKAEDLAKYGLDKPQITVSVWTESSGENPYKTFLIGEKGVEYTVYAKERNEADVIGIESSALDDFTKSPSDLRQRRIMRFASEELKSITLIQAGKPEIALEKDEEDSWRMIKPVETRADKEEVDKLVEAIKGLKVAVFEDDSPKDLTRYGLDKPRIQAEVKYGENSKKLLIGSKDPNTGRIYVKLASQPYVYSVESDIADKLTKDPFDLRDKTVISFQRFDVERIEVIRSDEKVVIRRKGESKWVIEEPIQVDADDVVVGDLLFALDSVKAKRFVSEKAENLARYGLEEPRIEMRLQETGRPELHFIKIGDKAKDGVYVLGSYSDAVMLIGEGDFEKLDKSFLDLRTKTIWDITTSDVAELELKHDDLQIKCVRKGYNWHIVSPVKEKANNTEVNDILYEVRQLKALRFVPKPAKPEYGLDKPQVYLKMTMRDGETSYELSLGKEVEGEIYAKASVSEYPFMVDKDILEKLKKRVEDLREK
jgi:hypothetical protein